MAATASGSATSPVAMERCSLEPVSGVLTGSLSCSPPRVGTVHGLRRALAPSHCLAPGKTRRRRQRRDGKYENGGDGDDGGSSGGGGGGGWFDGWDGGDDREESLTEGFWIWQVLSVLSLYQTFQFLLENGQPPAPQAVPIAGFATLCQTFYGRRIPQKNLLFA